MGVLFINNLRKVKQATITWDHAKRLLDEQDHRDSKFFGDQIINRAGLGFLDQVTKAEVISCEARRRKLLGDKEAAWRLKSRALLLTCGDENTKFFKLLRREGNYPILFGNSLMIRVNQSLLLIDWLGWVCNTLETYSQLQLVHLLPKLFTLPFFSRLMDENDKKMLLKEVTNIEILKVIHFFQKDKSPRPDEWLVEFYLGFFDLVGGDLLKVVEESK